VIIRMRAVIQRVTAARVEVNGSITGQISTGMAVFLGVGRQDTRSHADKMLEKILGLRIFGDEQGRMNRDIVSVGGEILIISQFTLYGDCRRGRRPSFDAAADPHTAAGLYDYFVERARAGPVPIATGVFQASMQVHLVNDGPVTILMDSDQL
jgi:D-aminoacyl-tRNA deacylase